MPEPPLSLTFDDVLLVPRYSDVAPSNVSVETYLTKEILLKIPLIAAAMDTVTESRLAIALSQEGGIGIIHKNMPVDKQVEEVKKVKRFEAGILRDPVIVAPDTLVADVISLAQIKKISSLPVVDKNQKVVGIVTNRDFRFENNLNQPVRNIMTPREKLITVPEGSDLRYAQELMHNHRLERLLIVNDNFELAGLITLKDILSTKQYPRACKDSWGRLRVGAAVGVSSDSLERIDLLAEAGVDILVVDTAHGHSQKVIEQTRYIKDRYPKVGVISGNIATGEGAAALADAGADAVKVGIGPGSICTTRIVAGVGVPQITAISNVSAALKGRNIAIIADGGIRYSGDIAKAIAAGAHCVMMGGLFAGTEEAPGEVVLYQGRSYKSYRGMGSITAMREGSADRYFQTSSIPEKLVPEGIEGRVPYKGPLANVIFQLIGGLRSSMGYCGCRNIEEMRSKNSFVRITSAGMNESHVHDVQITTEAPNYSVE
ncbi:MULTISPECIES: IMP dehydrogenase [Candidatus Ichthyocystis]|uniref:Inosine-5'-monophosphate dehydrogenase n=1 Tax=Candidatus Ichthyocystis hellenicum TaxID=1561003 RepID=A0A0S4M4S8_9BURK|nr:MULTISPECIES: IMP dehydrogenase [Ichthyocystis]CUT18047.1 Inosine-5'-monophosphate dehydrogenase [Candidatus Ichthyocystis hellenicum]